MGNNKHTTAGDPTNDTRLNFRIIICATLAAFAKRACCKPEWITFLAVLPGKLSSANLSDKPRPDPEVLPPPKLSSMAVEAAQGWQKWASTLLGLRPFLLCTVTDFSRLHTILL